MSPLPMIRSPSGSCGGGIPILSFGLERGDIDPEDRRVFRSILSGDQPTPLTGMLGIFRSSVAHGNFENRNHQPCRRQPRFASATLPLPPPIGKGRSSTEAIVGPPVT